MEYGRRLEIRRAAAAAESARHRRIGNLRFLTFVIGVALGVAAWRGAAEWAWIALPAGVFAALVVWHGRVARAQRRFERASLFYQRGLARIDGTWSTAPAHGKTGERFLDHSHPYAGDLDLFGRGSLFELLSTTRTRAGDETLAAWLLSGAQSAEVRARQAAVGELRGRVDLREEVALLGDDVRGEVDPDVLVRWATAPPVEFPAWATWLAPPLGLAAAAAAVYWLVNGTGVVIAYTILAAAGVFARALRTRVRHVLESVEQPGRELRLLAGLLDQIAREPVTSDRSREIQQRLRAEGLPPVRQIARLERLLDILDSRRNMLFAPLQALLLLGTQLAFAIERWRLRVGRSLPGWIAAVGEFEALLALAGYSYEHPRDPFPEVVENPPCFESEALAHPLIPETRAVANDVRFGSEPTVLICSGSNMSGKSTFLRTLGCNAVLALMGAPVRARWLRLSFLTVGASIRTVDNLQEGVSRFYAEITRLRLLVELARSHPPLLFLLDELLHGTNSHDRRIGAEAVVRSLVEAGALGVLTTHDLALADIVAALGPRAANVHFEDHLEGGRMAFDYRLRPGVVTKSNALELMRSVGLDV